MADIVTNTLQIGNNNLILRDADAQEQISGLKEDLSESVGDLKSAISDIKDIVYDYESASIYATASGWRLNESNGLCSEASGYKIDKYAVTSGQIVKVVSDDRFQFQNSASVPSTAPNNRVGGVTYGAGTFVLEVPSTATYIIVSTTSTGSTASVVIGVPLDERLDFSENSLKNSPFIGKSFTIPSGVTHSSTKDQVRVNIKAGEKYKAFYSTGLLYAFYSDGTDELVSDSGVASKDIVAFGIYKTNSTANPLEVVVRVASNPMGADALDGGTPDELSKDEHLIIVGEYTQQTETGYGIKNNVSVGSVVDIHNPVSVSSIASIVVERIYAGMPFRVWGSGTYYYLLWAWLDKDCKLISKENSWVSSGANGMLIVAPTNAKYLVCCSDVTYQYGFKVECLCSLEKLYNAVAPLNAISEQKTNIKNNLLGSATADFVFFSDIHGASTNFNRIIDYADDNDVDAILNGGDTIVSYLNDDGHPLTWYTDGITASSIDVLSAVGNHDVWDGGYWVKADATDVYNAFVKPTVTKYSDIVQPTNAESLGLCYYYKDYSSVRVIVLNAMYGDASVNFWDTTQANWLTSVLSDAKTNSKHVLIVNHAPFQKTIAIREEKNHWNSYIDYRTSSTYDGICTTPDAVDIVKTFVDGGGKFVGWLTGHIHADSVLTATGYDMQMMFNIATANNAIHPDGISYTDASSQYYDCFNHLAVDTAKGLVKMIRVGWNTDYSVKVREQLCYDYINGKLLTDN